MTIVKAIPMQFIVVVIQPFPCQFDYILQQLPVSGLLMLDCIGDSSKPESRATITNVK
jgi:hypothetical protein